MLEELETGIVGAVLLESKLLDVISHLLKPEHFYSNDLRIVFKAIKELQSEKEPTDQISVINRIKKYGMLESIGGAYFVMSLCNKPTPYASLEKHSLLIIEKSVLRDLSLLAKKLEVKTNDAMNDSLEVMNWLQTELKTIETGLKINDTERIGAIISDVLKEIRESITNGKTNGLKSYIDSLDKQTNGWQDSDLIIVAGRPAMGKTSAALQFALNPAMQGIPTAFFSLEMSKYQLANRVMSLISYMPVQRIVTKQLDINDLNLLDKDGKILDNVPFFIDDTATLSISDLNVKARKLKREHDIKLLVVDYLQLMKGSGKNRENEISEISRGLKILAKELNIPVIALSQLSRSVESRADKKPILSDLRESGAIEQDADMVIFTYRPEYYEFTEYELGGNIYPSAELMVFIIAKFRQGQTGEVKARWIAPLTKITNYEQKENEPNNNFLNEF